MFSWVSGIYGTGVVAKGYAQLQKEKQDTIALSSRL